MKKIKRNQRGFTLVELLVVIAIIGILAVVAVPALFRNISKAKVADVESDYSAVKSAVLSYYSENNKIPVPEASHKGLEVLVNDMDTVPTKSALGGTYKLNTAIKIGTNVSNQNATISLEIDSPVISVKQFDKLKEDIGEDNIYINNVKATASDKSLNGEQKLQLMLIKNTDM